jgi:ribosomal subunit interface protein
MAITITGKHIEVGESLSTHVKDALSNTIHRYMDEPLEGTVVLSKENLHFRADVTVHISKNFNMCCHGVDEDAYKSCDTALRKLEGLIRKYKNRLRDRKRKESDYHALPVSYYVIDAAKEEDTGEAPAVIAESSQDVIKLSVGDAVMRLDLSGQPVLLFRNAVHNELNVVYRRQDGNIGWIDPTKKLV